MKQAYSTKDIIFSTDYYSFMHRVIQGFVQVFAQRAPLGI